MEITYELLLQFKERMKISHTKEDDNIKKMLSFSYAAIKRKCGVFDIETHEGGRELVFERARYSYNDAVEYFDENFASEITGLALDLYEGDLDETKV
ncbi:phage gp6-like head-tail connector protein [Peribacillus sp. CSMR9]|uniref:phage gp6-like head-tail connector protein n=1 Tax=Peribacillus sp. CSMR9 TaxID=2981350 RepID=UPI002954CAA8|nr:phage gp6-like head-tail connector protein [Peribacillus sp. CSMR9]MDV7767600.1 phage gp6-like head-tail connector protein [Peribacillus sp. CSMR9]